MAEQQGQSPRRAAQFVAVKEDDSGQRLDNFLLRELKGVPRTRIYRAIRKGEVRINKGRVRADYRLVAGDSVRLPPLRQSEPGEAPAVPPFLEAELQGRVVYEDQELLVLNKPSGLAVHGGSGLSYGLIEALRQLRPETRYLELVHRLDRDTSGLILIAKRAPVLRELHRQLREKHVEKRYLALVAGQWPGHCRQVEAPLQKNVLQSGERMVRVHAEGQRALTQFAVLERFKRATLIEARPVTGRTHQIRVHAQHVGFPLLGDDKYSDDRARDLARELGLKRLFLHAQALSFAQLSGDKLSLEAALDDDLEDILNKLRN